MSDIVVEIQGCYIAERVVAEIIAIDLGRDGVLFACVDTFPAEILEGYTHAADAGKQIDELKIRHVYTLVRRSI